MDINTAMPLKEVAVYANDGSGHWAHWSDTSDCWIVVDEAAKRFSYCESFLAAVSTLQVRSGTVPSRWTIIKH